MDKRKLFSRNFFDRFLSDILVAKLFQFDIICSHNADISHNKKFRQYLSGVCELNSYLCFLII